MWIYWLKGEGAGLEKKEFQLALGTSSSPVFSCPGQVCYFNDLVSRHTVSAFSKTRLPLELWQVLSCESPALFLHTPLEEKEPRGLSALVGASKMETPTSNLTESTLQYCLILCPSGRWERNITYPEGKSTSLGQWDNTFQSLGCHQCFPSFFRVAAWLVENNGTITAEGTCENSTLEVNCHVQFLFSSRVFTHFLPFNSSFIICYDSF